MRDAERCRFAGRRDVEGPAIGLAVTECCFAIKAPFAMPEELSDSAHKVWY